MSTIRRQSIISSLVIYFGFAVGLLNTYFFTRHDLFTTAEYGLYSLFNSLAALIMSLASLAMPSFLFKFYHYYNDNLPRRKNDILTWALVVSTAGFLIVMTLGMVFKQLVIRKYGANAPLFLDYYYWIFPLGFGFTIYCVLEAYATCLHKSVLISFLREAEWRLLTTVLIVLFWLKVIPDYSLFIKLYSFTYLGIALTLAIYLKMTGQLVITFRVSKVTRRFFKKMLTFCVFLYSTSIIINVSAVFDTLVIASVLKDGLQKAGIFGLATLMTSVIQAPQRGIISAAIPHIARAWKDKNLPTLQRIYQRSSINQLLFATTIFILIALNYREAIITFGLKPDYLLGYHAFILLGLTRIIDMGTGVNAQIIGTSNYWRFELITGLILLALMLPVNYLLTVRFDILGSAIANLVSFSIYNSVRVIFLWKKFRLQPFTPQTLYALLAGGIAYLLCHWLFHDMHGLAGLALRSLAAFTLLTGSAIIFKLSPDIAPVLQSLTGRLSRKR